MTIAKDLITFAKTIMERTNTLLPARVINVNSDGSVNVVLIRNDEVSNCVITVPVIRPETQRAFIQLAIKAGDRGVVKFCDKSIENYRQFGSEEYNGDDRRHSISDGVFQLGFLPDNEKFIFPDGEIVIGLKDGKFLLKVDEAGNLTINAPEVTISSEKVVVNSDIMVNGSLTATNDVIGGGISLMTHIHSGVSSGNSDTGLPK